MQLFKCMLIFSTRALYANKKGQKLQLLVLKNWWKNERQRERKSVNGGLLLEKKRRRRSRKQNIDLNRCKEETNGEK